MSNNIYIFSRPIRSGKTTELIAWAKDGQNIAGILTPDVNSKRKLLDLRTNIQYDLEKDEAANNIIAIGRFHFDNEVFKKAQGLLLLATQSVPDWLIVDEVGKLEIEQNTGLEPAVSELIQHYKTSDKNLLLVIRDTLLDKAIEHYQLQDAIVINNLKKLA